MLFRIWQQNQVLAARPNTPSLQQLRKFQQASAAYNIAQLADETGFRERQAPG